MLKNIYFSNQLNNADQDMSNAYLLNFYFKTAKDLRFLLHLNTILHNSHSSLCIDHFKYMIYLRQLTNFYAYGDCKRLY